MRAQDLRRLIGTELDFRGSRFLVHEVLDAESAYPALVLRQAGGTQDSVIQGDQWGDAHRRVTETISLPIYDDEGRINAELAEFLEQFSLGAS